VAESSSGRAQDGNNEERQKIVFKVKPRPEFPEALRKEKIEATVTLRAVFTSTGRVENIKFFGVVPRELPDELVDDLTRRCKAAARKIEFEPAKRNGRFISMYVQLEYNFRVE
jgi:TonB family protein